MKKNLELSTWAFWDTDFSILDFQAHKTFIIRRVFEHWKWDDIMNIIAYYGDKAVIDSLLETEFLS